MDFTEDFETFTLSYTCPHTGIKISVFCGTPDKAEEEMDRMFARCGSNIAYSID